MAVDQPKRVAPYATVAAVSEFFEHIRSVRTPEKVDSSLLQDYGIAKSQAFPLLSTLKFLGVIEADGTPTAAFRAMQTEGDEFRTTLREVVEHAYSDLFGRLDVSRDTRDKVKNFLARNYSPATAERATALFLDLCAEAGITTAAASQQRQAPPPSTTPKARSARRYHSPPPPPPPPPPTDAARVVLEIRLTEDDLRGMDPADIESVFTAAAKIEMARRKSRNQQMDTLRDATGEEGQ